MERSIFDDTQNKAKKCCCRGDGPETLDWIHFKSILHRSLNGILPSSLGPLLALDACDYIDWSDSSEDEHEMMIVSWSHPSIVCACIQIYQWAQSIINSFQFVSLVQPVREGTSKL